MIAWQDPVSAHIARLKRKAKHLHKRWRATGRDSDYVAWAKADLAYRQERWDAEKVQCPMCHGSGEIVYGWDMGSWLTPPEPVEGPCPLCRTSPEPGWVLPETAQIFLEEIEQ